MQEETKVPQYGDEVRRELTKAQRQRYNRHLILDGFGSEGQQRLLESSVLIVGAGGLGSPVAAYLAAAGVGTIGLVDGDTVGIVNLQRQVLHTTPDVGLPKTASAQRKMNAINPEVKVVTHELYLTEDNALDLIRPYDFVIDGTDNFASKYLVNDACVMLGKPFAMGGINRYQGQLMTHVPGSACYRCLFPEPPALSQVETCSMVGVLGPAVGVMGSLQATEAVKYLAGVGEPHINALLLFDALSLTWQRLDFHQDDSCPVCGAHPTIKELHEYAFQPCSKKK